MRERDILNADTKDFFYNEYLKIINHIQSLLNKDTGWGERYLGYKKRLFSCNNTLRLRCDKRNNLFYYTNFTNSMKATDKTLYAQIRYSGQPVGKIRQTTKKNGTLEHILIIDAEDAKNNCNTFVGYENNPIFNGRNGIPSKKKCDWHTSKTAEAFRKFFREGPKKGLKSNSKEANGEHTLESAFISEIEKRHSKDKSLLYIQPIKLKGLRFQFPTGLSASNLHNVKKLEIILEELKCKNKGGGIDILARRKTADSNSYLTVIELKDEYKNQERPELAIMQAIAYATFLRELIRYDAKNCDEGPKWYNIFGFGTNILETNLEIKCVVAMPNVKNPNLFIDAGLTEIPLAESTDKYQDKLLLHCIDIELLNGNKNEINSLIPDSNF
ncbi:MAG: hypothetical protein ACI3XC_10040 [Phascolarctobacterium sp.]